MRRGWLLGCVLVTWTSSPGCVRWGVPLDRGEADSLSAADTGWDTEDEPDDGGDEHMWPEPWPIDPDARVVVWGRSGIPTKNLEMFANILVELGRETEPSDEPDENDEDDGTTGGVQVDLGGGRDDGLEPDRGTGETGGTGDTDAAGSTDGTGGEPGDTEGDTDGGDDTEGDPDDLEDAISILWISDCDPRSDALGCLSGNVEPFFEMVAQIGTIEFKLLSVVDPLAYDVVVADFCQPVRPEEVGLMLGDGARVLVLGDYWCHGTEGLGAEVANELLEHIGARFNGDELYNHDFLVAAARQVGVLEGIARVDAWGLALQDVGPGFESLLQTQQSALLTRRR
jgi:hypothetical protein